MTPNYVPADMIPHRGEGSLVWDIEGREYIDLTGGIAVLALGHNHPEIVAVLKDQAEKLWHVSNYFTTEPALVLAESLCQKTFAEKVFFANSGSEANEAALKLARRYAFDQSGMEKNEIVSLHLSFHGRSLFTVSTGGQKKYSQGFGPLPPKIIHIPHDDEKQLRATISDTTCAVILEPIMAESGVIDISFDFIQKIRELCDQHQSLLIFDEVQTGMGRTGSLFAYQQMDLTPDILTVSKALGCGFPIGAMMTTTKIAKSLTPGSHGSTFGGNPLATAVAKKALDIISDPRLLEGVRHKRKLFEEGLTKINRLYPFFDEIRGMGLLIGCQLLKKYSGLAGDFVKKGLTEKVMLLGAGPDVIRFAPSLIIKDEQIKEGLARFEKVVKALHEAT